MRTSEYTAWVNMKQRCYNPNMAGYERYGGKGVRVCKRWRESFENFIKDMGVKPSKHHSIDRINNRKVYSKKNCRWATRKEQQRNRENNIHIKYNGKNFLQCDIYDVTGISVSRVRMHKFRKKISAQKAFNEIINGQRNTRSNYCCG